MTEQSGQPETIADVAAMFARMDAVERSIPWEVERGGVRRPYCEAEEADA